jgi:hypothetical protein
MNPVFAELKDLIEDAAADGKLDDLEDMYSIVDMRFENEEINRYEYNRLIAMIDRLMESVEESDEVSSDEDEVVAYYVNRFGDKKLMTQKDKNYAELRGAVFDAIESKDNEKADACYDLVKNALEAGKIDRQKAINLYQILDEYFDHNQLKGSEIKEQPKEGEAQDAVGSTDEIKAIFDKGNYRIVENKSNTKEFNSRDKRALEVLIDSILNAAESKENFADKGVTETFVDQNEDGNGGIIYEVNVDYTVNTDDKIIDVVLNSFDVEFDTDI